MSSALRAARIARRSLLLLVFIAGQAGGEQVQELEFRRQRIADIAVALGEAAGLRVVPDQTVAGTASYVLHDTDARRAFRHFVTLHRLQSWERDGLTHLSRVRVRAGDAPGTVTVEAFQAPIPVIVDRITQSLKTTVLCDPLPEEPVSCTIRNARPERVLEVLLKRFPEYRIEKERDHYFVRHGAGGPRTQPAGLTREGDSYSVAASRTRLVRLIEELFTAAGREHVLFSKSNPIVERLAVSGRSFDEMLTILLEQGSLDVAESDGLYVLFDVQQRDILKQYKEFRLIPLASVSAQHLVDLLPSELAAHDLYKVDAARNAVILMGSREEIDPVERFIRFMDQGEPETAFHRLDLSHTEAEDFLPLAAEALPAIHARAVPNSRSVLVRCDDASWHELRRFAAMVDRASASTPIRLRYVPAGTVVEHLPPSVDDGDLVVTPDPSLLLYVGPEGKTREVRDAIKQLDRPAAQIRYQLFIVQYERGSGLNWSISAGARPAEDGAENVFVGSLGELLSLDFDLVAIFGYQLSLKLAADLADDRARVFADTTLSALSGQEAKFQNTSTYRYRDTEVDPDTGEEEPTGVVREITSGLILTVTGTTMGEDLVTMDVTVVVSKRGADTSGGSGGIPPTSEKIVDTHVRTHSGKPVVIGGLLQRSETVRVHKVPLLGDIPLLGLLFQRRAHTAEETELAVYLVPHVEAPASVADESGDKMKRLYQRHVNTAETSR